MSKQFLCNVLFLSMMSGFTSTVHSATEECVKASATTSTAKRRRPGQEVKPCTLEQKTDKVAEPKAKGSLLRQPHATATVKPKSDVKNHKSKAVSPIPRPKLSDYVASIPVPDRWRIVDTLGYEERWYDPYNRNALKGDKPVMGEDWFINLGVISDTVYEFRQVATPVGSSSTQNARSIDVFGSYDQTIFNQNLAMEFVLYKGDTVFRPPDYEFRFIPVLNYNRVEADELQAINVDPSKGITRSDGHLGLQAAFFDAHLRNVSEKYDFDSLRVGIQPFSSDFRGFLFQDNQLGIRLFGTRDNNIFQYNVALFQRLEKDTNSGLNDQSAPLRDDFVFTANLYWQDFFVKGFTSQFSYTYNKNYEDAELYFDNNKFIARPASLGRETLRGYDVSYLGYSGDGHFGRLNLTTSLYYAIGKSNPGVFVDHKVDISAGFFAAELSVDFDWIRTRFSMLYASGDKNPYDDKATGFDAIFENPQFAGSDTSYWIRQNVPLIGGGRVALSSRNGVLNSLRSSKEQGQSNFTNPGTGLIGFGFDADLTPQLRLSANLNQLYFAETAVIEAARNQGNIDYHIGQDFSISTIYRPFMSQNIVFRASYTKLFPGSAYEALFNEEEADYFLFNLVLTY